MNKNSINKVMLAGFIDEGPTQSFTTNGSEISIFSLSTEEKYQDKDGKNQNSRQAHRCICFGRNAENANKYFSEGQFLYLEGSIRSRDPNENNDIPDKIIEINVSRFTFLDSPNRKPPELPTEDSKEELKDIPPSPELPD